MADLDEFFAKKSKKRKSKGGKKEGDGASKLEKKEEKESQLAVTSEVCNLCPSLSPLVSWIPTQLQDSEWKEEESQVEVTAEGLKVQALVEWVVWWLFQGFAQMHGHVLGVVNSPFLPLHTCMDYMLP